jgi:hypothetical protein
LHITPAQLGGIGGGQVGQHSPGFTIGIAPSSHIGNAQSTSSQFGPPATGTAPPIVVEPPAGPLPPADIPPLLLEPALLGLPARELLPPLLLLPPLDVPPSPSPAVLKAPPQATANTETDPASRTAEKQRRSVMASLR